MSNSMRELGGLVDNLYISSQQQRENKSRHPADLPGMMSKAAAGMSATPSRARKAKVRAGGARVGEVGHRKAVGGTRDRLRREGGLCVCCQ